MKVKIGPGIKWDGFWWGLLILVPIAGIFVINIPPNLRSLSDIFQEKSSANLDAKYRERFSESLRNNPNQKQAIEQEIAFSQQRLAVGLNRGLNRAGLAAAYLKMARTTGEGSWFLLAQQAAQRSIADLPFW